MELPAAKNLHQQFFTEGQQQEENAPQKVLGHHAVAGKLIVPRQRLILVDDLLRRATNLALGPRAFIDAVRRMAVAVVVLVAVVVFTAPAPGFLR